MNSTNNKGQTELTCTPSVELKGSASHKGDDKFGSCNGKFAQGNAFKEVVIDSSKGHAAFRLAKDEFTSQWMRPMQEWISAD